MNRPRFEDMEPMTRSDWYGYLTEELPPHNINPPYDDVNNPNHYKTFPDAEAIDLIERILTDKEYMGYLKGNYLKYKLRAGKKDNTEKDLAKADWYQGELFAKHEELYNG